MAAVAGLLGGRQPVEEGLAVLDPSLVWAQLPPSAVEGPQVAALNASRAERSVLPVAVLAMMARSGGDYGLSPDGDDLGDPIG